MSSARLLILALLLALAAPMRAPAEGLLPELDTASPRALYQTFLAEVARIQALHGRYQAERTDRNQLVIFRAIQRLGSAAFDLSAVPPATRHKHAGSAVGYLADILHRLPPLDPATIPGTPPTPAADLPARWTIPGTELRMRRLAEGPLAGNYVFSDETLARLPEFHAEVAAMPVLHEGAFASWRQAQQEFVGPLLAGLPIAALPAPLRRTLLDTPAWKTALSLLLLPLVPLLTLAWARRVRFWAAGLSPWRHRALWLTAPTLLALLTVLAEAFIGWEIGLSGPLFDLVTMLAVLVLFGAAGWAAWLGCWLLAELIIATPSIPEDSFDSHLLRLLARIGSALSVGLLAATAAGYVGVPALGLLAGVGVGGIALALAAQSTVENLFGGISIFADRPFRVGDLIRYGAETGTVEAVGPRSTRIRGLDGTLTAVPNADLARIPIVNLAVRERFLFQHRVTVVHGAGRVAPARLTEALRQRLLARPEVAVGPDLPRVRVVGFGGSTVEIELFAHVLVGTDAEFLAVQEALILGVLQVLEATGDGGGAAGPAPASGAGPAIAALPPAAVP